jgi:hypothetical protein
MSDETFFIDNYHTPESITNRYQLEYINALNCKADRWVSACGGNEIPFTYENTRYLYVFNHAIMKHGWLNMDTDIVQFDSPVKEFN